MLHIRVLRQALLAAATIHAVQAHCMKADSIKTLQTIAANSRPRSMLAAGLPDAKQPLISRIYITNNGGYSVGGAEKLPHWKCGSHTGSAASIVVHGCCQKQTWCSPMPVVHTCSGRQPPYRTSSVHRYCRQLDTWRLELATNTSRMR